MKRLLLVIGTRPEAIKLAPVYHALRREPGFEVFVCLAGQHREILDQMVEFFEIPSDCNLNVMEAGQDLFDVTSKVLLGMRGVLNDIRPDVVLVQGDTTTVMAAAVAAFYAKVAVGHVEAGLRTWNLLNPYPEEFNRCVADLVSRYHFAPTELSKQALMRTGIQPERIHVTGNTVIDALHYAVSKLGSEPFRALDLSSMEKVILLTTHRRESFGGPIRNTLRAVAALAKKFGDLHVVFPAHPNPSVRQAISECLDGCPRIHVIAPQSYPEFVKLMRRSDVILTDSGGVQEEAPGLGKPVLVLRETTERPEGITAGTAKLVGTDPTQIEGEVSRLITDREAYRAMSHAVNPYGDGKAAERIVKVLKDEPNPAQ